MAGPRNLGMRSPRLPRETQIHRRGRPLGQGDAAVLGDLSVVGTRRVIWAPIPSSHCVLRNVQHPLNSAK
jgi:hypothetical protein